MIRPLAILLVMASSVPAAPPARYGRIDAYSVDGAFHVRDVRVSPGAQVLDVGWRGAGMADTGATAQARAREVWREVWIELVPERDGKPAGNACSLRAGDNELLIAYEPPVDQRFSPEHAGPMFRIVDARSGRRIEDVRYQP